MIIMIMIIIMIIIIMTIIIILMIITIIIITIIITLTDGHVAVHRGGGSECPRSTNGCIASSTGGDRDNYDDHGDDND